MRYSPVVCHNARMSTHHRAVRSPALRQWRLPFSAPRPQCSAFQLSVFLVNTAKRFIIILGFFEKYCHFIVIFRKFFGFIFLRPGPRACRAEAASAKAGSSLSSFSSLQVLQSRVKPSQTSLVSLIRSEIPHEHAMAVCAGKVNTRLLLRPIALRQAR